MGLGEVFPFRGCCQAWCSRWWQLKDFLFSPRTLGEDSQFDYIICFRWVETTNQCFFGEVFRERWFGNGISFQTWGSFFWASMLVFAGGTNLYDALHVVS